MAQAISNQLQIDLGLEFVTVTTEDRFEKVTSDKVDMLCVVATITMERQRVGGFHHSHLYGWRGGDAADGCGRQFRCLADKKIGVRSGTTTEAALNVHLEGTGIDAEVIAFDDHSVGMGAMSTCEISACFADQSILLFMNASLNNGWGFKVMNRLLTFEKHGIAIQRGDTKFRFLMDGILFGLYGQGAIKNAFRRARRRAKRCRRFT